MQTLDFSGCFLPKWLRYFMQRDGAVLNMVLRIFLRGIAQSLQSSSPGAAQLDEAGPAYGCSAFHLPLCKDAALQILAKGLADKGLRRVVVALPTALYEVKKNPIPKDQYTELVYNRSTRIAPPISDRSRLIPELEKTEYGNRRNP